MKTLLILALVTGGLMTGVAQAATSRSVTFNDYAFADTTSVVSGDGGAGDVLGAADGKAHTGGLRIPPGGIFSRVCDIAANNSCGIVVTPLPSPCPLVRDCC